MTLNLKQIFESYFCEFVKNLLFTKLDHSTESPDLALSAKYIYKSATFNPNFKGFAPSFGPSKMEFIS